MVPADREGVAAMTRIPRPNGDLVPDRPLPLCRKCGKRPVPPDGWLLLCDPCLWEVAEHYGTDRDVELRRQIGAEDPL